MIHTDFQFYTEQNAALKKPTSELRKAESSLIAQTSS